MTKKIETLLDQKEKILKKTAMLWLDNYETKMAKINKLYNKLWQLDAEIELERNLEAIYGSNN